MAVERSAVQSVDRMLTIIELLSYCPHGMALTELSLQANLHVSTTHRLLSALISNGYVRKVEGTGYYELTLKLFEVGSRVANSMNLLSVSRPALEQLTKQTQETVHLVARDGNEVVYLCKEEAVSSVVRTGSYVGLRNPMYCTGVGKCILAFLPEQEVKEIWEQSDIVPHTENTITRYEDLVSVLAQVRKQGWALDCEEHEVGISCIAAPIFDYTGRPIGAVSISAPSGRLLPEKKEEYVAAIQQTARKISSQLGND